MKRIRTNIITAIILSLAVLVTSCKKWIDPEMNDDPNKPTDVSLNLLLPSIEAGIGYAVGGDLSYATLMWMQQYSGLGNQPIAFDRYNYTQSDVDNVWKWALYAGVLKDLHTMADKADEENSPYYGGIARVLTVYMLGTTTDLWGDVPYSDAFQGNENLKPVYDTQQQIYDTMAVMINEAIADLTAETSNFVPGSDDLIYGGDLSLWLKAAYAVKARYALHLSERDATAYQKALDALSNGITSNEEDLEFHFGTPANEENPLYQFLIQRPGDITMCANFVNMLIQDADPRLGQFCDTTGGNYGAHPGTGDGDCPPSGYYTQNDSPVPFVSYVELLFIKAESEYKLGIGDPKVTVKEAVAQSLAKFGIDDPAWTAAFAAKIDALTGEELYAEIMRQKYIALFNQVETFTDWRRTGYPELEPAAYAATNDGQLPRRYPYPTSERIYNGDNMPDGLTLSTRVWWDLY
ncbi:MAG TPA: SusD/RagB family nutrient-binding outer membrane lipoprotein [Bacteroidales bacterium]|nr:SusD/RagB family nutrient-binding outer membrane lipoprotein [Bacteroidales bacterium]HPM92667.1 SusD/RagB family nutrient-binding outer membrane lipoprotein [Bacteroidales bacterium]